MAFFAVCTVNCFKLRNVEMIGFAILLIIKIFSIPNNTWAYRHSVTNLCSSIFFSTVGHCSNLISFNIMYHYWIKMSNELIQHFFDIRHYVSFHSTFFWHIIIWQFIPAPKRINAFTFWKTLVVEWIKSEVDMLDINALTIQKTSVIQ